MGTVPKAEIQRDQELIADYLAFNEETETWMFTLSQLGWKYRRIVDGKELPLTSTRIYQILDKHGIEKKRVVLKKSK